MQKQFAKLLVLASLLLFAPFARAQQTLVTGTVQDPNGIPYSGATIKANLTIPGATVQINNQQQCASGGYGSAPCFVPISGTVGPTFLDPTGSFSLGLYPNASIFDAQGHSITSQWTFTISIAPGIPQPFGNGPQAFSVSITIAGSSQSVSSTLSSAAPKLTNFAGGGGTSAPQPFAYLVSVSSGTITVQNQATLTTATGSDFGLLARNAIAASAALSPSQCATFFMQPGDYTVNSLTTDIVTSTTHYAIAAPAGATPPYCFTRIVGATASGRAAPVTPDTSGVIIDVTATAVSSVSATDQIDVLGCQPDTSGSGIGVKLDTEWVVYRLPSNARAHEGGLDANQCDEFQAVHNVFGFNQLFSSSTPNPPSGTFGIRSTQPNHDGNISDHNKVVGWDVGWVAQTEHIASNNDYAFFGNRSLTYDNAITAEGSSFLNFEDVWNVNGPQVSGPGCQTQVSGGNNISCHLDLINFMFENLSGNYARSSYFSEAGSNLRATQGLLTYSIGGGIGALNIFSQGGNRYLILTHSNAVALPHGTVGNLFPATDYSAGSMFIVSDGASATDCTTGGGSTQVICISDGTTWRGH